MGYLEKLFEPTAQEIQLRALDELAQGCRKHPSYRYKRKPTAPCKRCVELWELRRGFEEWQTLTRAKWLADMEREREQMREWSRMESERINSPG